MKTDYKTVLVKFGKMLTVLLVSAFLTWAQVNYVELIKGTIANEALAGGLIVVLRTLWSLYDMKKT